MSFEIVSGSRSQSDQNGVMKICLKPVTITGARGTDHPPFSNFLFTNLFSIKFLYFFIISSLFPYFNLFVSIFIQSYVNIKLHVSTLLDTNNTQGMQLGRFKNRTPARFEYIYCTLFPLCHSNQDMYPFLKDASFRPCFCFVHTIAQFSEF